MNAGIRLLSVNMRSLVVLVLAAGVGLGLAGLTAVAAGAPVGANEVVARRAVRPLAKPGEVAGRIESVHTIESAEAWAKMAARPASQTVARTEVVKFLLDRETGRTLWFVDSERYDMHYAFAAEKLSTLRRPVESHAVFNVREYRREDRRFELGSIVHYLDGDLWTLEMIGGDTLAGEKVLALYQQLRGALWIGDRLRYRPLSGLHEELTKAVRDKLAVVSTEEVFAGVKYQPLTEGKACGYLRIVRGALEPGSVRPDQILVLEQLPEEIPVSAAVISQPLQAPLGHIAVLCAGRKTPNMGLRGALDYADVARLEGKLVELSVGPQEFGLREVSLSEAETSWKQRRPSEALIPKLDRKPVKLSDLKELSLYDADFAGAKAAQLAQVGRLGKEVRTPGGFVIPMAHYLKHFRATGAERCVDGLLMDEAMLVDVAGRTARLAEARALIETKEVDAELLASVHAKIQATAPTAKWILRSSTNAEDLAGFSGAGLYRSVVVKAGATPEQLAKAIREVWASVWLAGAFEERSWYRVDHRRVAMAILAQPFVDGALANGVAITANPFTEGRPGFLVNVQTRGGSVTGAHGDEVPEQVLIYTYSEDVESEVLARSSRTGGKAILSEKQIAELAKVLGKIHDEMRPRWGGTVNAVDVEFLLAGEDAHVVIVQARPYTVNYGAGRRLE
ncbi:hypothetical protein CMV30_01510 [Nibricoccus aquaticus]|uniref:Phosphoenolpyruvate synthase n=1 Tax=Nibricoccus aquaticus TaxID=2576891 RepID=A0A290QBQ4_9BACT|nr:PEP/pyruvate-binding domain-containing protein [Nibricoccus aquaticus]ATC62748.1 hypothetical protein CMV30_01510 [Nibricoccus aquaticus]